MANDKLLNKKGQTLEEFLKSYDPDKFKKPSVTVDTLLFSVTSGEPGSYRKLPGKELKILMIKRGDHPCIGQWALPGGFVEMDENIDTAAARELMEETGIENIYTEQLYTWGNVGRDPRTRIISCSYMALVDSSKLNIKAGDDADAAAWFTVSTKLVEKTDESFEEKVVVTSIYELSLTNGTENPKAKIKIVKTYENQTERTDYEIIESSQIAFDHAKVIQYGILRLRSRISYSGIAFSLLPELFTLTELQKLYEAILDTKLLKSDFRRKISNMVTKTDKFTSGAGHRPSMLYKYNPLWGC